MRSFLLGSLSAIGIVVLSAAPVPAQPKKDAKSVPRVIVALPFAVKAGATTRVSLRGFNLDKITEAVAASEAIKLKLLDKNKSGPPDQKLLDRLGDTQATVEVTVPLEISLDTIAITLKSPDGATEPHQVLIDQHVLVAEKEPNEGFRQPQAVTLPLALDGAIKSNQDVDVFRFEGKTGQQVAFEVKASRYGSPVEVLLTLYDGNGNQVAAGRKCADSNDSTLTATLPRDGGYFLTLQDAHDLGSAMHQYRLFGK